MDKEPEITYTQRSSMHDYAPLSWSMPKQECDLTAVPCEYAEAVAEAELSIKQ